MNLALEDRRVRIVALLSFFGTDVATMLEANGGSLQRLVTAAHRSPTISAVAAF